MMYRVFDNTMENLQGPKMIQKLKAQILAVVVRIFCHASH